MTKHEPGPSLENSLSHICVGLICTDQNSPGAKHRSRILIRLFICGCSFLVPLIVPHYPEACAVMSSMCVVAFT